jgi:hypothetical protein
MNTDPFRFLMNLRSCMWMNSAISQCIQWQALQEYFVLLALNHFSLCVTCLFGNWFWSDLPLSSTNTSVFTIRINHCRRNTARNWIIISWYQYPNQNIQLHGKEITEAQSYIRTMWAVRAICPSWWRNTKGEKKSLLCKTNFDSSCFCQLLLNKTLL